VGSIQRMRIAHAVDIPAPVERVWQTYSHVELWPHFMEPMSHVDIIDGGPLQVGSQVWIKQPKLGAGTWEVTEMVPGRSWTWVSRRPGITVTAVHLLEPIGDRHTRVDTTVDFGGPIGALLGHFRADLTRRYLAEETDGLREACTRDA
jgi:uncharacterized membrane protein